jgi:hypothetical protein
MKIIADAKIYGKAPRDQLAMPSASAAMDIASKVIDASDAIHHGDDVWKVGTQMVNDLLSQNVQSLRMIANRTYNQALVERSQKFRDLEVFQQMQGLPSASYAEPNKYLGIEARRFKQAPTLQEAMEQRPEMMQIAREQPTYELMKQKMESYKSIPYRTMPSPQTMPLMFHQYYNYLSKTYGPEVANARLQDYYRQTAINKAKSQMFP